MAGKIKAYRYQVGEFKLTVRPLGEEWSISIQDHQGNFVEPIHDFAPTLNDAKLRACKRAAHFADLHIEMSVAGDPCEAALEF